jgi:hypothetical protein
MSDVTVLAQSQLIDRVLARVGTAAVTLTDVQVLVGLGIVDIRPGEDRETAALLRTIERRLILDEVTRFPPTQPAPDEIARQVDAMKASAGAGLEALMAANGLDEARLEELARDTLRMRAYIGQRFGTTSQVTDEEVRRYYDDHPDEFTRDGVRLPFEEVEATARQRASAERLRGTIDQWIADLRTRAEIVVVQR